MTTQAARQNRPTNREQRLDQAIAHLESVHKLILLKRAGQKILPFPVRS